MLKKVLFGLTLIISFAGCLKNSGGTSTCSYDPCSIKAPQSEIDSVKKYLASKNISAAIQHCSGLFYQIVDSGTGRKPVVCNNVNVSYVGKLTNDTTFDQRTITLSLSQVITGWENGIPLIREGGRILLYIPPSLGYGGYSNGPVPANSILIFDVKLNAVQ